MKKLFLLPLALLAFACGNTAQQPAAEAETETPEVVEEAAPAMASFGAEISADGAVSAAELPAQLEGQDSVRVKLTGSIDKVCQMKGCWMTMDAGGQNMHVTFKDYGFFVPKDAGGNEAVIEGFAYVDTMDVETLRHYAEDEGKSAEEVAMITEPEVKLSFVADGVIIKGYEASEPEMKRHDHDHEHGEEGHSH